MSELSGWMYRLFDGAMERRDACYIFALSLINRVDGEVFPLFILFFYSFSKHPVSDSSLLDTTPRCIDAVFSFSLIDFFFFSFFVGCVLMDNVYI